MQAAGLSGRVLDSSGRDVSRAQVELWVAGEPGKPAAQDTTDARGRFEFTTVGACPCTVRVEHPWFHSWERILDPPAPTSIPVQLRSRVIPLLDEIRVSGDHPLSAGTPIAIASSVVEPSDPLFQPTSLTELIQGVPGVAENGQGGLFQVASVRGTSRERVLTMVSDIHIVSERRAGVSTSFLDPTLLNSVEILRGPSASFYGSGALGGVIQVHPRKLDGWSAITALESSGRENVQTLGWGGKGWSVAGARREARDAEAPDGSVIFSHFHQYSGVVDRTWETEDRRFEVMVAPSIADDIAKANTDYPERTTRYPEERHLLARMAFTAGDRTRILAYVHPNDLITETTEEGAVSEVDNEAFDFGAAAAQSMTLTEHLGGRVGLDYFGRRQVNAIESSRSADGVAGPEQATLRRALQDELALYGAVTRPIGSVALQGGLRGTLRRQDNTGWAEETDAGWNGFAGAVAMLGRNLMLSGEVANGIRFPNLSERFFTGTTGRGGIIGNPDLERERATSFDLGGTLLGERGRLRAHGYYNWIDDYIERVEVEPDLFTFVNLVSGRIAGMELDGHLDFGPDWSVRGFGQVISSRDSDGEPLADAPADRFELALQRRFSRLECEAAYQYRFEKDDPGPGEKPIGEANLVTLRARQILSAGFAATLSVSNLLDEQYFAAADSRAPPAPGRSVALTISFRD